MRNASTHIRPENLIEQFGRFAPHAQSGEQIESILEAAEPPPFRARFWQYVIYSKEDLARVLLDKFSQVDPVVELIGTKAPVFRLRTRVSKNDDREVEGLIVILAGTQPNFYRILTVAHTLFWDKAVRKLVAQFYPSAMPVFFKQTELKEALLALENSLPGGRRLWVSEVTRKHMRQNGQGRNARQVDTERVWTWNTVTNVFEEAEAGNHWFTSVRFKVQTAKASRASSALSTGFITKRGELGYNGLFTEVKNFALPILERTAAKRLALYQNRGLRERNFDPSLPIAINYNVDVFSDIEEVRRFARVMNRYPNANKAVFHANPYYHASVADFLDGSSFELWALSPRRALIIPQAKSSAVAFERLISYIFAEFREGTPDVYQRSPD